MRDLELQVDTLMRLCTAETSEEKTRLKGELCRLLEHPQPPRKDPEYQIRKLLLELGTPENLLGHPYVVEAVCLAVENRFYIHNLTFGLYPQLAVSFDTTASRVERAIRHLIEVTWSRGDLDILGGLFGNTVSPDRGKPTNGEFLARLTNLVRQRMKEA